MKNNKLIKGLTLLLFICSIGWFVKYKSDAGKNEKSKTKEVELIEVNDYEPEDGVRKTFMQSSKSMPLLTEENSLMLESKED